MADKRDRLREASIGKVMAETMSPAETMVGTGQIVGADGSITIGGYTATPLGLQIHNPTFEDWEQMGMVLFALEGSIQLLIGDWLVEAEREYNKTYQELAAALEYSVRSLYQYKWTAENVPIYMRHINLTFSHYAQVAALDDDRKAGLLRQAAEAGWTVKQLKDAAHPPALPEENELKQLSLFDLLGKTRVKPRWLERRIERVGEGDESARLELLGKAAQLRRLADALERMVVE